MSEPLRVEIVPCLSDNYAYLIVSDGQALVVDPSEAGPVRKAATDLGLKLVGIWCTHHHADHVGGVPELLAEQPTLPVVGSRYDAEHKRIPGQTQAVEHNEALWFAGRRARTIHVPGHTLGAISFLIDGLLFSGDTLFAGGCGRMFEGTKEGMQASLDTLRGLPDNTLLYCGHEYTENNLRFAAHIEPGNQAITKRMARVREQRAQGLPSVPDTIAEERATNPFLRWAEPAVIAKASELGAESSSPPDVFAAIRKAKDKF